MDDNDDSTQTPPGDQRPVPLDRLPGLRSAREQGSDPVDAGELDGRPTRKIERLTEADLLRDPPLASREPDGVKPDTGDTQELTWPIRPPARPREGERSEMDPPELPAPPVRFVPPELHLPHDVGERMGGTIGPGADAEDTLEPRGAHGEGEVASLLHLTELTPFHLPFPLEGQHRDSHQTTELRTPKMPGAGPDHGSDLAVISQVVDVPVGAVRPDALLDGEMPGDPPTDPRDASCPRCTAAAEATPAAEPGPEVGADARADSEPTSLRSGHSGPGDGGAPDVDRLIAGRYRVVERIGQGGMARIFRVEHTELGKFFALKIIHTALSGDPRMREMFYREARLASSLEHPNIVSVTDFGVDERLGAFIVMELLKGESLHARLRRDGRLHQNVACEVTLQLAGALQCIHGNNVVHCDIKSDNVFLCDLPREQRRQTQVKLLDFGLSRPDIGSARVALSEVGGTPAYMAPERIRRTAPRPSMDIYSLGVLTYEMLTGTLPFSGSVDEVLAAHLHQEPPPLSERMPDPPDDRVQELIHRALQKDPERRQRDMGAFIYELRTVMDMLGIGRRRGAQPLRPGAVAAAASGRPGNHERLVSGCPLPLFMADTRGTLLVANAAFASFINLPEDQIPGMLLRNTRLGRLCPDILRDLETVTRSRKKTQRLLTFPRSAPETISMMVWLAPRIVDRRVVSVVGVVHPFSRG